MRFDPLRVQQRRQRMALFRSSGIIETPEYARSMKRLAVRGGVLLAIGIVGCVAFSPSGSTLRFCASIVALLGGGLLTILALAGYRAHRKAIQQGHNN